MSTPPLHADNIVPSHRAPMPVNAALPEVQVSFEAILAQTLEPPRSTHTFGETGVVRASKLPAVRSDLNTSTFRPDPAREETTPAPAMFPDPSEVGLGHAVSPECHDQAPHQPPKSRAAEGSRQDYVRNAESSASPPAFFRSRPSAGKAFKGRVSAGTVLLRQFRSNTLLVALAETTSGVRVLARVTPVHEAERTRMRQQIHALLAQHGIHSATIEVV